MHLRDKEIKKNSKFFKFDNKQKNKNFKISFFNGWNRSLIIKILFKNSGKINNFFIKNYFPNIFDKEKIFITISGKPNFKKTKKNINLKKFDAICIFR